jgi:hypothetical protein
LTGGCLTHHDCRVKHSIVTLLLMLLSAGAAYTVKARAQDESMKQAQDESMRQAEACLKAARRVRDKDQQRCYRAVSTRNPDLCDWQAAQATEPWEGKSDESAPDR